MRGVLDLAQILTNLASASGGGIIVGLFAWLRVKEEGRVTAETARHAVPSQMVKEAAEFQRFLNEHSEHYVSALRADIEALRAEVDQLKEENTECRAESADLRKHVEHLENVLRENGLDVPRRDRRKPANGAGKRVD